MHGKEYTRSKFQRYNHLIQSAQACIEELRKECPHETSVYAARGSGGHWDRDDSYWYDHYCYDCGKRWTTDQGLEHRGVLEVKEIDYSASPREIELLIELAQLKKRG